MTIPSHLSRRRGVFAMALMTMGGPSLVHALPPPESPTRLQGFSMKLFESGIELRDEWTRDQRTVGTDLNRRNNLSIEESVYVDLRGAILHPNFIDYILRPSLGLSYQKMLQYPPGGYQRATKLLQRYHFESSILKPHPYATQIFADRDITFRDFDFFSRAQVNSLRYGFTTGYQTGLVPLTASYLGSNEHITGSLLRDLTDDNRIFTLTASHKRKSGGSTELKYEWHRFDRSEEGRTITAGTNHQANLQDSAQWDGDGRMDLFSNLSYYQLRQVGVPGAEKNFALLETLMKEHSETLSSNLNFTINRRLAFESSSLSQDANASITHQLFRSLNSRFQVQTSGDELQAPLSSLERRRVGAQLTETYTKRLGSWGRLSISGDLRAEHTSQKSSGQLITVNKEGHVMNDGTPVMLRQPDVQSVLSVSDQQGRRYSEMLDYILIQQGRYMELRRVPGGLIPAGGTVFVSYNASAPRSGAYSTLGRSLNLRLDLYDGLLAIYGRLGKNENWGPDYLVLQDIYDRVLGVETEWRMLRAGAEKQEYLSSFSPFISKRCFESLNLDASRGTLLTLELNQEWMRFPDSGKDRNANAFIARFRTLLSSHLTYSIEGGVRREQGSDYNQRMKTLRSQLDFDFGKLVFHLGYEYERENYILEQRMKHFVFFYAKRRF